MLLARSTAANLYDEFIGFMAHRGQGKLQEPTWDIFRSQIQMKPLIPIRMITRDSIHDGTTERVLGKRTSSLEENRQKL
jgi:hypothetical protein